MFIAIIDDDDSPDGELVVINASIGQGSSSGSNRDGTDRAAAVQPGMVSVLMLMQPSCVVCLL
jgi:hypothetical protein